jgi:ribonuclease P protein component
MPGGARPQGLSRRHRFAARGSFGPVLASARKFRGTLAVVHAAPGAAGRSRLGVALTRRLIPSSVERNRVKRIVREVFRAHAVKQAGVDCVVTLRGPFATSQAAALARELGALFDQLCPRPPA